MSELLVNTIKKADGTGDITVPQETGTLLTTASGLTSTNLPVGSVIKVAYTQTSTPTSVSLTGGTDATINDLSVSIVPSSSSSIIRIDAMVNGEHSLSGNIANTVWLFDRDGTKLRAPIAGSRKSGIAMGQTIGYDSVNTGSTPEVAYYSYFDTPATTGSVTYKVVMLSKSSGTWFLNRTVTDDDADNYERGFSFISVTEIKG